MDLAAGHGLLAQAWLDARDLWATLAIALSLWLMGTISVAVIRTPDSSRYLYPGALVVLIAAFYERFRPLLTIAELGSRIRGHGDFHLARPPSCSDARSH